MTEAAVLPPEHYVERVALTTGDVVDGQISPADLLVQSHRDYHVVDIYAHYVMGLLAGNTEHEEFAHQAVEGVRRVGHDLVEWVIERTGLAHQTAEGIADRLFGVREQEYYFRFKQPELTRGEMALRLTRMQEAAVEQLERAVDPDAGHLELRVLLTGATGFLGKEILWQAVQDPDIAEIVCLVRPKTLRDRETGEVLETLTPTQRGETLLDQLWIDTPALRDKVRFIAGDIERTRLGIADQDMPRLRDTITHVVHCAASVEFDAPYEESYRANVLGTLNALALSQDLQRAPGSPYVAHIGVETSYIHGRQRARASEDHIVFPRNFYNNYYELTKALAAIETERIMWEDGLRVVQLCPAIVIGDSRTGNNRGDTKVVNAPVNAFGRAQEALATGEGSLVERSKGWLIARLALLFPGAPEAEINLIPVDWVVRGILKSLKSAEATGERIHLATDKRLTAGAIRSIVRDELDVQIRLAEPVVHRNLTLPLMSRVLERTGQPKLARALEKLSVIFGGYSEPNQPIHEVGHDVQILGMPDQRPETEHAFRMLCRHNKWVQEFGRVRDLDELSRRERAWAQLVARLEQERRRPAGAIDAAEFRAEVDKHLDLETWELRK